jgi:hypothetical protein
VSSDAPARRLLAGLVDEQDLETEPIAEVRADLAALGLDSARATALAHRLAAGAASPAATLLAKIAAAEDDDDEIARFERAEGDSVRRRLGEGTAAAAIANAQRAAGGRSNVTGLRRRRPRRLLYGLGGLAVALAASVVFYVGLSPDQVYRGTREMTQPAQKATSSAPATNEIGAEQVPVAPPPAQPYGTVVDPNARPSPAQSADSGAASSPQAQKSLTDSLQSRMQPAGNGPADAAEQAAAAQRLAEAEPAPKEPESEADKQATGIVLGGQPQSQATDTPAQTATSATTGAPPASDAEEARGGNPQALNQAVAEAPPAMPDERKAEDLESARADADAARERRRAAQFEGSSRFDSGAPGQQSAQGDGASSAGSAPSQPVQKLTRDELAAALEQRRNAGSGGVLSKQQTPTQQQPASETAAVAAAESGKQEAAKPDQRTQTLSLAAPRALSTKPPPFGLSQPVVALLVVDPKLVPADVQQKDYAKGDLRARLDDARFLAGGRAIVALVTLRVEKRTVDAIIIQDAPSDTSEEPSRGLAVTSTAPQVSALGPILPGYQLIELDGR